MFTFVKIKNKLLAKGEDTENPKTTLGAIASVDQEMIVTSPANGDGKSSISSTNAPNKTTSHDILGPDAIVDQQMTVLSPAPVQECLVMETDKDEVSAKLNKSQKRNTIKRNNNLEDKREGTKNPGSLGAIASVDPKMMVLTPAATVEEKSSIPCTNATDQIASGEYNSTRENNRPSPLPTRAYDAIIEVTIRSSLMKL